MKERSPLVSIVIPNYNYERFIAKALDSALSQTYENVEIVVVDDCSSDRSVELISSYISRGEPIHFFQNKSNRGVVDTHNRCIKLSHGEYIVVLSSDDYLHPDFVKEMVEVLDQHPTAAMAASDIWYVDNEDAITASESFYPKSFFCKGIYQCKVWLFTNTFVPSQVLFRRTCIEDEEIGGMFSYLADTFIDTELWYRMCLKYDFIYLKKKLAYYRMHTGSYSKSYENMKLYLQWYLARKRFGDLAKNIPYLAQYAQEAVMRTTRMGTRYIRILLQEKNYGLAERYLHITEGFDLDIQQTEYYAFVVERIQNRDFSEDRMEKLLRLESTYNESKKSEEHKGQRQAAPYDLPDVVEEL